MLRDRGIDFTREKAVRNLNVDFAVGSIAVEIWSGNWHPKATDPERTRLLLDLGWHVLFVWTNRFGKHPMTDGAVDQLIAFQELARRDEAAPRQYRVVRGDGEWITGGSADDEQVAFIPPPKA